jgi:PhzF family phenazine biosynthesis protein
MSTPLFIVDAFTDHPFAGNPAAVCLHEGPRDESWMQDLANEMNLSETAFLFPESDGYRLRWFTPTVEVALCGHATLASAHILWETERLAANQVARFHTLSGLLTVTRNGEQMEMDFPARRAEPCPEPAELTRALGASANYIGRNGMDYLVEVANEETLCQLKPDFITLATLPVRGVIVTCKSATSEIDFISRFFAPGSGVNEDPVTGSAHCALGPYWSEKLGKVDLVGFQASARGGTVRVGVRGERVLLGGQAVTIMRGTLAV